MRESLKLWITFAYSVILLAVLGGGGWLYYWWTYSSQYPYGWSHSCDKLLTSGLIQYAEAHGGAFPAGEATPEASLSLLYPKLASAEVLRGKIVPLDVVKPILDRGECLGPDTCGWHYVEGLRTDDDSRFALCWDKAGLGHNGQVLPDGGHFVIFIGSDIKYIKGSEWPVFLEEQERLLKKYGKKRQQLRKK